MNRGITEDNLSGIEKPVDEEALKKAEKYIEEDEGLIDAIPHGLMNNMITVIAVIMSLVHLYAAVGIITPHILRGIHVMFVTGLVFLVFPVTKRFRGKNFLVRYSSCFRKHCAGHFSYL